MVLLVSLELNMTPVAAWFCTSLGHLNVKAAQSVELYSYEPPRKIKAGRQFSGNPSPPVKRLQEFQSSARIMFPNSFVQARLDSDTSLIPPYSVSTKHPEV